MNAAQARAVIRTLDRLREYESLDATEIALLADAKRALGIPTTLRETLEARTPVTPYLPPYYADMDSISGGFR